MFRTLRTKFALAFVLITMLSILVVGVASLYLLRDREIQAASQRTGDLLPPEVATVAMLAQRGIAADRIASYLRQRASLLNVRFILLDESSRVLLDTDGRQSGRFQPLQNLKTGRNLPNSYHFTVYKEGPTSYYAYMQSSGPVIVQGERTFVPTQYNLVMLVPEKSITSAWMDLAPRLLIAAAIALVASLAVAYLVARSITKPLARITRASEAMAQGQYEQRLPVEGRDEVARLAQTFNGMAVQVSHSHQMMRDLVANVAHELKTPLTSIQGFSQALADGALQSPAEYSSAARIINEESDRMRRLVDDLLYLSQMESGQIRFEPEAVDTAALLHTSSERVRWQIGDSGKRLVVTCEQGLPSVWADPRRIEQVLANLLDNAIRYTPDGGQITLRAAAQDSRRIRFEVHNTGSTIPPDELPRIFERFYQVDRSRQRNGRNGGLGLAIAKEIVLAHGGSISVASTPVTGTTFSVILPIASPALPAARDARALSPAAAD
jgi:signal transduction histidine kinase